MDFSDLYINMCDQAKEVQFAHTIFEAGDFYYEGRDIVTNKPMFSMASENHEGKERAIGNLKTWLPRQDQLQEMIGNYSEQCNITYRYIMQEILLPSQLLSSMEQLWLTIIMKEKHNKFWTGMEWIKRA